MSDPQHWQKAKQLFDEALTQDAGARETFLRRACEGSPELLAEVQSLLDWHEGGADFLETPAARVADLPLPAPPPVSLVGREFGPWRIVDVIGRGGMGVVYRAERADDAFTRQAAIKVVRSDADSAHFLERFLRERSTLAALDHPRIARLMDGGTTPEGQPYFVMELVDGVPVDEHCDGHTLSIGKRLELFRAIAAAVQYAHENLVIHRDLKPENILIGRDGRPKLLDFGVAKILSHGGPPDDGAATMATWLLTPDYASPEQINGRAITTASDVYALGVLLHVLLTGVLPYHLSGTSPEALRAELAAARWRLPSERVRSGDDARARAALRGMTPGQLSQRLRGDLDAIVGRALGRDLSSRYSTVEQLVGDLERHRLTQPVAARGREPAYLARTFMKRHAVALILGAGVLAMSASGVVAILYQTSRAAEARARAERRFDDVRRLARTFLFDVHDSIVNIPGTTAARTLIVRNSVEYLDSLAREAQNDRGLQRELASAFVRVGDAQGNPAGPNLGDTSGAIASYERAIGIAEALRRNADPNVEVTRTLALAHRRLADALAWTSRMAPALEHAEQSDALYREIGSAAGATIDDRLQVGIAQIKLGDLLGNPNFPNLGRPADSAQRYDIALTDLRRLDQDAPGHSRVRRYLGLTLERIGTLHEQAQRWPEATRAYRDSFEIRRELATHEPVPTDIQRDLAIAYEKLGNVQRFAGQVAEGAASYRNALSQFERLSQADPTDANASRTVAISRENLADALAEIGQRVEARQLLTAALATHEDLAARDEANTQARCDSARVAERVGDLVHKDANTAGADASCTRWRQSLTTRSQLAAKGGAACATAADIDRLTKKLVACATSR